MIVGVGIELVEPQRFADAERRFGERLRERLFTERELAYAARRHRGFESLAARFAAKAAARRALASAGIGWREVEVVRERGRAPSLHLHGAAARAARALGVSRTALTLTHERSACVAQVILEGSR